MEFLAWFNSSVSAEHNGASFMKKYLPQAELWLFLSTEVHSHFSAIIKFIPNGRPFSHSRSQMCRLIVPMGSTQRVLILVLRGDDHTNGIKLLNPFAIFVCACLCVYICVCVSLSFNWWLNPKSGYADDDNIDAVPCAVVVWFILESNLAKSS